MAYSADGTRYYIMFLFYFYFWLSKDSAYCGNCYFWLSCSLLVSSCHVYGRLFSCGTNKEGESYIVEWNESEGAVKRTYHGLGKRSVGVVQFDTTRNRFLAAGDEFQIKFWDMDNVNLLKTTNAEGGLPVLGSFLFCCLFSLVQLSYNLKITIFCCLVFSLLTLQ